MAAANRRQVVREEYEQLRAKLFGRQGSYRRVLGPQSVDGRIILADLARFCRAHRSTAHVDPQVSARLDGRREVWLRIAHHLNLDSETLWQLYDGATPLEK